MISLSLVAAAEHSGDAPANVLSAAANSTAFNLDLYTFARCLSVCLSIGFDTFLLANNTARLCRWMTRARERSPSAVSASDRLNGDTDCASSSRKGDMDGCASESVRTNSCSCEDGIDSVRKGCSCGTVDVRGACLVRHAADDGTGEEPKRRAGRLPDGAGGIPYQGRPEEDVGVVACGVLMALYPTGGGNSESDPRL